jgi:hypothetical protein
MLAACEGLTAAACLQHQLQFSKLEAADAACWCCESVCLLEFSPVVLILPRAQPYPSCSTSAAARAWLPALEQHGQRGRCRAGAAYRQGRCWCWKYAWGCCQTTQHSAIALEDACNLSRHSLRPHHAYYGRYTMVKQSKLSETTRTDSCSFMHRPVPRMDKFSVSAHALVVTVQPAQAQGSRSSTHLLSEGSAWLSASMAAPNTD